MKCISVWWYEFNIFWKYGRWTLRDIDLRTIIQKVQNWQSLNNEVVDSILSSSISLLPSGSSFLFWCKAFFLHYTDVFNKDILRYSWWDSTRSWKFEKLIHQIWPERQNRSIRNTNRWQSKAVLKSIIIITDHF